MQILAYAGQCVNESDAQRSQLLWRPDARPEQQCWGAIDPCAQDLCWLLGISVL